MGNSQGKEIRTSKMTVRIKDMLYEGNWIVSFLLTQ